MNIENALRRLKVSAALRLLEMEEKSKGTQKHASFMRKTQKLLPIARQILNTITEKEKQ